MSLDKESRYQTKLALAYGFEYDLIIPHRGDTILCKSPITGNPIYCTAIVLDTDINQAISMARSCQLRTNQLHRPLIRLLEHRQMFITQSGDMEKTTPKWQLVLHNHNSSKLKIKNEIESKNYI
jgi:hypothetical protein